MTKARPLLAFAYAVIAILTYLVFTYQIDFTRFHKTSPKSLIDFPSRLKFVIQQQTLGVTWLLVSMFYVISKRVSSPAMDPTSGHEKVTEAAKNNLQNSLEQFIMSSVSQLILVTHLSAVQVAQFIPAINLSFIVGRVLFLLGYPKYRGFGFALTSTPIMLMIGYNLYKFFSIYY
jgi:hypothetical protein